MTAAAPQVALAHLDHLWFQVGGTLCNLTCHHCFISCSPTNHSFGFVTLADVRRNLEDSVALGVKEYYFTGGEPFLNREMTAILVETLRYGPATVLTNATVLRDEWLAELAEAEANSPYSLEFRVSIDGFSPATNDPIRGEGTFERAMRGVRKLVEHRFLPIITAARTWAEADEDAVVAGFVSMLRAAGYERPRLKVLPTLRLGAEETRTGGYDRQERVTAEMLAGYDQSQLICEHSRIVTDRGVYVCPILIDSPEARLGDALTEALGPYPLRHGACFTCYQHGAICSNPSSGAALETHRQRSRGGGPAPA
jgi:molybdenum cofactor biosynthesis enzyme MoaA